ncbi:MAG: hypothetical protein H0T18_06830 [Chloroflexia bacterium]|nr:hypothetical protein [Chloroflexia bacterium]
MQDSTSPYSTSPSAISSRRLRLGGRNGALAALLALFVDLLWRVVVAPAGVPSIPETVVTAVARLTPTALFGWATENLGSLAQNALFAGVLVGIVAAGAWAGNIAGVGVASQRFGAGRNARLFAALAVGLVLFLIVVAGVFPLAREGFFASGSGYQGVLLAQAALFSTLWAVAWVALGAMTNATGELPAQGAHDVERVSRRLALRNVGAAGLTAGVAFLGWRLARTPVAGDTEAQPQVAAEIVSRARLN